jgi:hypothetical protein
MLTTKQKLQELESRVTFFIASDGSRMSGIEYDKRRTEGGQKKKAGHISRDFIVKWAQYLQVNPRDFDFKCSDEEAMYITRPSDATYIHKAIEGALIEDKCTVFIDAFACVGGDTLAAMNQFNDSEIYAIQIDTGTGRIDRLENNILMFQRNMQNRTGRVHLIKNGIKTFLTGYDKTISVLYLDPPWALGEDHSSYSHPVVLNDFLNTNVWTPLRTKEIYPLLIVLKLPGNPTSPVIEEWPTFPSKTRYRQIGYLTPSGKYAVYILRRVD